MDQPNGAHLPPMRSQDYSEVEGWPGYFTSVLGKGARETLVAALDSFDQEGLTDGLGVDIAAGEGRDALEPGLTTVDVDFAETQGPDCDMVKASFALPFCDPVDFPGLWSRIVTAIRPGGRFAGQFFGDRDSWASFPGRTHHSPDEVARKY